MSLQILVVDDERAILTALKKALENLAWRKRGLKEDVPFHLTLKSLAAVRQDHVPASCVPYYKSLLSHQLRRSLFPWSLLPAGRR